MALKPTIYKMRLSISDFDRNYFDSFDFTLAQHPSETLERMMARVVAFSLNAHQDLKFTKGLSATDEPELWQKNLHGDTELWIDVGEPSAERLKKACRLSKITKVYSFNTKANVWWSQGEKQFTKLSAEFYQLNWSELQTLASWVERNMDLSISISDSSAYITSHQGECAISWLALNTN